MGQVKFWDDGYLRDESGALRLFGAALILVSVREFPRMFSICVWVEVLIVPISFF